MNGCRIGQAIYDMESSLNSARVKAQLWQSSLPSFLNNYIIRSHFSQGGKRGKEIDMKISGLSFSCFPRQRFISAWNKHALLNQCCPQPPVSPRRTSNLIWLCKQKLTGQKKWSVPTTEEGNWEGTGCRRWCLLVEWQANISTKHVVRSYTATAVRILEQGACSLCP